MIITLYDDNKVLLLKCSIQCDLMITEISALQWCLFFSQYIPVSGLEIYRSIHVTELKVDMSCYIMSCYIMSRYIMSCYNMSCYIMSCYIMSCDIMSRYIMSRYNVSVMLQTKSYVRFNL